MKAVILAGGRGTPCGHTGRLVQTWTSLTLPSRPPRTSSTTRRPSSPEWPWLPIWVTSPGLALASAKSLRPSSTV